LQPAFTEQDGPALLKKIERCEPPRPREVRRDIPADLENIILKAMAKDRVDRYASAEQLAADLKCFLAGKPTMARPLSWLDRAMKWGWRHRRSVAAGFTLLAMAVIGLSITTLQFGRQKMRAEKNVVRADRYLNDARQMLDRFGVQLADRLEEVPGADNVRRELLQETCAYYQHFVQEASGDPALRGDLAVAYGKLAGLLNEAGSYAEGLSAQRKCVELFRELAAEEPTNVDYQKGLALSQNNLALLLAQQEQPEAAKTEYAAAIARQRQLGGRFPDDAAIASDLAASLGNLGLLQNEQGGVIEATLAFEEAIQALEKHGGQNRRLATAHNNLAVMYVSSQPERAAALHERALQLLEEAAREAPADRTLSRELALTLGNLGSAWSRTASPERAFPYYQRAIKIQEKLVSLSPATISYQRDLAVSHNNLGLLHSRTGRTEHAEEEFEQAIKVHAAIVQQRPQDAALQSSLAGIYNNLGIVLENSLRLEPAAEAFEKAIQHQQQSLSLLPEVVRYRDLLVKHQANRERVLKRLSRPEEAAQFTTLSSASP
jgi:tetratricopeptide (TPR) repeat protein